jgi:hypothetical protein
MPYREPGDPGSARPGPGGTSGGTTEFLIGLALLIAGGYLFLDNVQVTSHFGSLWRFGHGTFGLSLLPVFLGISILFFNGKSIAGWILLAGGAIIIFVGVISRLAVHWRVSSLFDVLLILALIAAGIGLIARSLRPHPG